MACRAYTWPDSALGLPPGEWVLKGHIRVFKPTPTDPINHGTERGYYQHRYYNQPQCPACKTAHTTAEADRYKTTRKAA